MSHCTHQTSLALKAAGLPQPDPKPGQFWYGKRTAGFEAEPGSLCVLIGTDTGNLEFVPIDNQKNENNKFFVFAPTIDYLLPLIGNDAIIKFRKDETGQIFECNIQGDDGWERMLGYHETNPAEAAAMAWLKINESPGQTFVQPGDIAQE